MTANDCSEFDGFCHFIGQMESTFRLFVSYTGVAAFRQVCVPASVPRRRTRVVESLPREARSLERKTIKAMNPDEMRRTFPIDDRLEGWFFRWYEKSPGSVVVEGTDLWGAGSVAKVTPYSA